MPERREPIGESKQPHEPEPERVAGHDEADRDYENPEVRQPGRSRLHRRWSIHSRRSYLRPSDATLVLIISTLVDLDFKFSGARIPLRGPRGQDGCLKRNVRNEAKISALVTICAGRIHQ